MYAAAKIMGLPQNYLHSPKKYFGYMENFAIGLRDVLRAPVGKVCSHHIYRYGCRMRWEMHCEAMQYQTCLQHHPAARMLSL